jgi:sugar O-acyltransferase (sialic acid O-acetyltransferase NeuD family)
VKKCILIGARVDGHASVVLESLRAMGGVEVVGFLDNTPALQGKSVRGIPIIGSSEDITKMDFGEIDYFHVSIGDNIARLQLFNEVKRIGKSLLSIVNPSAYISPSAILGEGCYIGPKAVINSGSHLGKAVVVNSGVIVEHDNQLHDGVHLAPGVCTAGRVVVNECAFVGLGATVLPDIIIGRAALVGAGSVVVKNVESNSAVIGYAAKPHKVNIYQDTQING